MTYRPMSTSLEPSSGASSSCSGVWARHRPGVACLLNMGQRIGVGYWTLVYLGARVSTMVGTRGGAPRHGRQTEDRRSSTS